MIHRDLTFDHILHYDDKVTGVIDWGDAYFGEPAFDLTGFILDYENKLMEKILDFLETPDHYLDRTYFYAKSPHFMKLYTA